MMRVLMQQFSNNVFIELLMLTICADTLLGVLRAIKFHQFNSSVGNQKSSNDCVCRNSDAGRFIDPRESVGFYTGRIHSVYGDSETWDVRILLFAVYSL